MDEKQRRDVWMGHWESDFKVLQVEFQEGSKHTGENM